MEAIDDFVSHLHRDRDIFGENDDDEEIDSASYDDALSNTAACVQIPLALIVELQGP